MRSITKFGLTLGMSLLLVAAAANAAPFTGTLYYTSDAFTNNVISVTYSYDETTQTLTMGSPVDVAALPGADGLILNPDGTHLIVGGQFTGSVYNVLISNGSFTSVAPGTAGQNQNSFHMTLDPGHAKFYTSDYYTNADGPLDTVPLPFGTQGTSLDVTGDDNSVTQIAFAPTTGKVFYSASPINCCGNLGTINLGTGVTTKLHSTVTAAHGIIYDPFTQLMTFFGGGEVGTMDQNGGSLKTSASLNTVFDQGAVDGFGHCFIAGNNQITFLDYHTSHDITVPDKVIIANDPKFVGIDDVAPLVDLQTTKCPLSQGYWKTHGSAWPSSCLPMSLGTHSYTKTQLLFILNNKSKSDASVILARQLIAAKLSICNGTDSSSIAATITDADTLIGTHLVPGFIKTSSTLGKQMAADGQLLDAFDNGLDTLNCTP